MGSTLRLESRAVYHRDSRSGRSGFGWPTEQCRLSWSSGLDLLEPHREHTTTSGPVVLRYFDCRSRGQALRFALASAEVDFDDQRVPIPSIPAFRRHPEGPFGQLPILHWGSFEITQTLAVAGYLEDRLAPGPRGPEERAFLAMFTSAAHLDTQLVFSQLLWRPTDQSDDALLGALKSLLRILAPKLEQLERQLAASNGPFFAGVTPAVADAFVYESLDRGRAVLGAPFAFQVTRAPGLMRLEAAMRERPGIADLHRQDRLPNQITGNPNEPVLRERIQGLISALGDEDVVE